MKRYVLAAVATFLVLLPWHETVRATAPLYTIQDLGNFNGQVPTISGVNAAGQVVGNVPGSAGSQAVRYTDGLGWEALPGLDAASFSVATGINTLGDVVGYRFLPTGEIRAFRYRDGTGVEDIAPFAGGSFTFGFAMNAAGTVVGYGDSPAGIEAFRADPGQPAVALPSFGGGFTIACGINDAGQIAGASVNPNGVQHGMRLEPGASTALEIQSLDGPNGYVSLCAIDADGRVGGAGDHGGQLHTLRYTDTGALDLDTFGSAGSNIDALSAGLSVGWYTLVSDGSTRAFAHRDEDGSFDLNTRISDPNWVLAAARGVNANGVIVGEGLLNGSPAAFRLTPVGAADSTAPVISSVTATPSFIAVPNGNMVGVTVAVSATDDSGEAPACSLASIAGGAAGDAVVTGPFTGTVRAVAGRTYTFNAVCVDAADNSAQASADVTVGYDVVAPVIASASASPSTISPADGRVVPVTVSVSATDDVDAAPVCSVTGVTGGAAGASSVTGPLAVQVKATGSAVYTVNVQCADAAGNVSHAATAVSVVAAPPPPPPPTDAKPPVIRFLYALRTETKVNGVKWESVRLFVWATDNVDHSPACSITSITGGPAGSFAITGRLTAKLRELRSAGDLDRVYVLNVSCLDDNGNVARATVGIDPNGRTTYSGDHRRWRW